MKLMIEDNLPDNVRWDDPHFDYRKPKYDPSEIRYAKIDYTAEDADGDIIEDTLYVDKFDTLSGSFADAILDNPIEYIENYIDDASVTVTGIGDITFVDYDGIEYDQSEVY